MSLVLYKRVIYTCVCVYAIVQHRKQEWEKPLWSRGGRLLGRLLTARNSIFKTCNLQSTNAILIRSDSVLRVSQWQQQNNNNPQADNLDGITFELHEKKPRRGLFLRQTAQISWWHWCDGVQLTGWWFQQLWGAKVCKRQKHVGLYRLVASATLPPANQVRDKHKDDKEAECHAHCNGHQKAQISVQEAFLSWQRDRQRG